MEIENKGHDEEQNYQVRHVKEPCCSSAKYYSLCYHGSCFIVVQIIFVVFLIRPCFINDPYVEPTPSQREFVEDYRSATLIQVIIFYLFALLTMISFAKLLFTKAMSKNVTSVPKEDCCTKCGVIKRPDIEHCVDCGFCVEGYDHHCGVVGVCIGDPNFKYFSMYFTYAGLMLVQLGICCLVF